MTKLGGMSQTIGYIYSNIVITTTKKVIFEVHCTKDIV